MSNYTFFLIKPDAFEKQKVGLIFTFMESAGFELCDIRSVVAIQRLLEDHYKDHKGKDFYPGLIASMVNKPVIAISARYTQNKFNNAILAGRNLADHIRRTLVPPDSGPRNLIHASDSEYAADREYLIWFVQQ